MHLHPDDSITRRFINLSQGKLIREAKDCKREMTSIIPVAKTKIDLKDRKILYELDLDCRQSNTQIGKKVGLTRDVVAYRIKRMEEEGVITNFWTAINTFKLG